MENKHDSNYHAHTYLCGHASGIPLDYVKEAIKHNFKEIGMSEHAPMANLVNNNSRMDFKDYDLYLRLLNDAKDLATKNNIKFYKGMEIEYFKNLDVYKKYLKDMDYLILGQHYIVKDNNYKSTYRLTSLEDVIIYKDMVSKLLIPDTLIYFVILIYVFLISKTQVMKCMKRCVK
ncbi:MAG: PHP domain-containing protein [Acholeplasmataceae bacterium]